MTVLEIEDLTKATPAGPPWQRGGESRGVVPTAEALLPEQAVHHQDTAAPATLARKFVMNTRTRCPLPAGSARRVAAHLDLPGR